MKRLINGITSDNVYRRIGWMYVSFLLLFLLVNVISHFLLPQGFLRGKHPLVSALRLSPNLWVSTLQIFGYNLIVTSLILGSSLLAEQSRICKDRFIPMGYILFLGTYNLIWLNRGNKFLRVSLPRYYLSNQRFSLHRLFGIHSISTSCCCSI
jgi:hypothetical protein